MGLFKKLFNIGVKEETSNIETPHVEVNTASSKDGRFIVEDVFTITGRGTVVTGRCETGDFKLNDIVLINGLKETTITGIEMFRKTLDYISAGDNAGLLISGIERNEIQRGDIIIKK